MNEDFHQVVLEFMEEYPMTVEYVQQSDSSYDPSTGDVNFTATVLELRGIVLDLTLQSNGLGLRPGTLIEAGDRQLFVYPPNKNDPDADPLVVDIANDRVRIEGIEYKIVTFKEYNPTGNDTIVFDFYIRR
jgi:hypothetical protein